MSDLFDGCVPEKNEKQTTAKVKAGENLFSLSKKGRITISKKVWKEIAEHLLKSDSDSILQETIFYKAFWKSKTKELILVFSKEKGSDAVYRQVQRHSYNGHKSTAYIDLKYPLSHWEIQLKIDSSKKHSVPFKYHPDENAISLRLERVI